MNGAGGAQVAPVAPGAFEARRNDPARWRIACINWSHPVALKAVAYYIEGDHMFDRYFKTWAEAVKWTDAIVRQK